jgi:hypothetical protein
MHAGLKLFVEVKVERNLRDLTSFIAKNFTMNTKLEMLTMVM